MRIPKISIFFTDFIAETEKAYLLRINCKDVWIPKSICSNMQHKGLSNKNKHRSGTVNISPFKYEELTGVIPQNIDSFVINDIKENLEYNTLPDYEIYEPYAIYLKQKQIENIIKIKRLKCFFVYGQMRTGKTVIATTIAESRYKSGLINNIVVIAPLRVKSVWDAHLQIDYTFIATEHFSNIHTCNKIKIECDDKTMIILDESHQIKNAGVIRVEGIINQTKNAGHKCILTGTPIGKHAGDLYYQFYFLDPKILNYNSYTDFSNAHLLYGGREGKSVVAYTNIEEVSKRISPYTAILKRKDLDIDREKVYILEPYQITNMDEYKVLKDRYKKLCENNFNNAILGCLVKLQQCANGFKIDNDNKVVTYSDNGRINCLMRLLDKYKKMQVVIYFKYNNDLKYLKQIIDLPVLSGKTSSNLFNKHINLFNSGEIKTIAIQQQISIGFSLRSADVIIYYSRKFGSISSAQSEDRACESIDKPLYIIDICAKDTIDELIKSTINKQFDIINIFKKEVKS